MNRKPRKGRRPRWVRSDRTDQLGMSLGAAVKGYMRDREKDGLTQRAAPAAAGPHRTPDRRSGGPKIALSCTPSPELALEVKQAHALRGLLAARIRARVREEGTERDRLILLRLRTGIAPTAVARELGLKPQVVQAFERKYVRWGLAALKTLQKPVAKVG